MATAHDADLTAVAASLVDDTTRTVFADVLVGALQQLIEAELTERIGAAPHERTDSPSRALGSPRPRCGAGSAGNVHRTDFRGATGPSRPAAVSRLGHAPAGVDAPRRR